MGKSGTSSVYAAATSMSVDDLLSRFSTGRLYSPVVA